MNWRRVLLVAPAVAAALSLWLPWVDHRAAGLVLTGLDLPEFVRFMGSAGGALVRPLQLAFALPLMVGAVVVAASPWTHGASLWWRAAMLVLAVWLVSVAISPWERRSEFLSAAAAVVAVWGGSALLRPAPSLARWAACLGGAAGGLATLWQFYRATPALRGLYGQLTWGVGPWVAAGSALLGAGLAVAAVATLLRGRRQRTVS